MKIIYITNVYLPITGGISTYIFNLQKRISEKGHFVKVLSYPAVFWKIESNIFNALIAKIVHTIFVGLYLIYAQLSIFKEISRKEKTIIHSHSAGFCLLIALVNKLFGCKTIHTYHSPISKYSALLHKLSPKADAIVYVSNNLQTLYQKHSNVQNEKCFVVPGGVEKNFPPQSFEVLQRLRTDLQKKYNFLNTNDKLLLFVGRIVPQKGVVQLVKSMKQVVKKHPNTKLILAGPYSESIAEKNCYRHLQQLIAELDLKSHIYFTGWLPTEELWSLYRLCDIFVCPSVWQEPSPMVVVETMCFGKPVVATKVGGLPERVIDGVTGLIIKPNAVPELADALITLLSNDALRTEMGKNARAYALSHYTIDVVSEKYLEIYNSL